jgi:hypothetical protein
MHAACTLWWEQEQRIIRDLGKELVKQAGPQAITGRIKQDDKTKKTYHYSAAEAYNQFLYKTSKREFL